MEAIHPTFSLFHKSPFTITFKQAACLNSVRAFIPYVSRYPAGERASQLDQLVYGHPDRILTPQRPRSHALLRINAEIPDLLLNASSRKGRLGVVGEVYAALSTPLLTVTATLSG